MINELRDWITLLAEAHLSVNWPYGLDEALEKHPVSGATRLTAVFEEHVTDYDNWSVDESILKTFPEVVGLIRTVDETGASMPATSGPEA